MPMAVGCTISFGEEIQLQKAFDGGTSTTEYLDVQVTCNPAKMNKQASFLFKIQPQFYRARSNCVT